jgi:hypothetical protein
VSISPVDAAVSSSRSIGRYFAVVSVVPAALLVFYVTLLLMAGAWNGPLDPGRLGPAIDDFDLADLAWFVAASLAVGLLIHPLMFVTTQVLEGYWGAGSLRLKLSAAAVKRHHRKLVQLEELKTKTYVEWVVLGSSLSKGEDPPPDFSSMPGRDVEARKGDALGVLSLPSSRDLVATYHAQQAYEKARAQYPEDLRRVMPTRLGNVLRRSEDRAGKQYGLDTMVIAPHLSLIAKPEHYAYVQDRQKAMDLAITMCLVGALATGISAVLLSDDGWWSLFSFVPFIVAYASYLGAVASARSYNVAMATVTDLSRFALYDALHVAQPMTGEAEVQTAQDLMALLRGAPRPRMKLVDHEQSETNSAPMGLGSASTSGTGSESRGSG